MSLHTETLVIGALVIFLAIKLPFLGLVFWIMMRHGGGYTQSDWSDRERSEILDYLRIINKKSHNFFADHTLKTVGRIVNGDGSFTLNSCTRGSSGVVALWSK